MRVLSSYLLATAGALLVAGESAVEQATAKTTCNNYSSRFQKSLEGVCVCNEVQCDSISNGYLTLQANQVGVYSTSKSGDRLTFRTETVNPSLPKSIDFVVETNVKLQTMIGFGGAFTDSAAINAYRLTPALQEKVLEAYFAESGLQYTVGRIPIASADFSESVYSYNPVVDDFEMKHFSINVDRAPHSNKLAFIQRALKTTKRDLQMFASSWAPPTWMTRENRTENCKIKGVPGEKHWKALALYYAKFIEAYEAEGIKIWGMTVQNEPGKPIIQPSQWQSLRLTPEEERDFIKKDLGPLLKSRFPNLKLIAHDDQKPDLKERMAPFDDPESRKYLDGVGVHWYKNLDFFFFGLGGDFEKLTEFHNKYPNLFILATEACEGYLPSWLGTGVGVKIQEPNQIWSRAENYARDIINDVANFAAGWTDWNLVLDTKGGPNWAGNFVDAPIIVDEKSGTEFYKQPMYYVMGHFSKFVPTGSVRVNLKSTSSTKWDNVDRVAFMTPEGRVVVVLFNRRDKATFVVLQVGSKTVTVTIGAKTLQTIIFPASEVASS